MHGRAQVVAGTTIMVPALPKPVSQYPNLELDITLTDERRDLIASNIDVARKSARLGPHRALPVPHRADREDRKQNLLWRPLLLAVIVAHDRSVVGRSMMWPPWFFRSPAWRPSVPES